MKKKRLTGIVVSDKMQKTIVVRIDSKKLHPMYSKLVKRAVKFKVHDEKSSAKTGDRVTIEATRPISREKRWRLVEILAKKG
ncbi:MAG: 30S ribosomal protein S17 [Candidatus Omnitrophota bacterium]